MKERLKKIMPRVRSQKKTEAQGPKTRKKIVEREAKKEAILGFQEVTVGKSKFSNPEPVKEARRIIEHLPGGYGEDKIVLQVRDPWWLHTYWEVVGPTFDRLKGQLGDSFHSAKLVLRVYDVSNIIFDGTNAHRSFDIEVEFHNTNWYIDAAGPGRSWCVDIGLRLANGKFIKIARSNTVYAPLEGPSWITDEEWMVPEEMFARLYGMGFGFGRSSPVGKAWQERMRKALFSGILASPGMASMASPVKIPAKQRKFWLIVNTELIVYGATEPDAKVTVQGREIKLRPDGTFSLRFALPDGKQVIPVHAVASDNLEERTITPIVSKETKEAVQVKG
jgi:hypothetical protein